MEGYYLFYVHVMNADTTSKQIEFLADTTTTWHKIRSYVCNNGGDLYYLYYDDQVLNDTDLVMPMIEEIDDLDAMVCATTERSEYTKRVKQMKKGKPVKNLNYRLISNDSYEEEVVESY
jgi:hypothetical protein